MCAARSIHRPSNHSGHCSGAASWAATTKSVETICRSTSRNFLSGTITERIPTCSASYFRAASKPIGRPLKCVHVVKAKHQKSRRRGARRTKARRHGKVRSCIARVSENSCYGFEAEVAQEINDKGRCWAAAFVIRYSEFADQ